MVAALGIHYGPGTEMSTRDELEIRSAMESGLKTLKKDIALETELVKDIQREKEQIRPLLLAVTAFQQPGVLSVADNAEVETNTGSSRLQSQSFVERGDALTNQQDCIAALKAEESNLQADIDRLDQLRKRLRLEVEELTKRKEEAEKFLVAEASHSGALLLNDLQRWIRSMQ